MAETEFIKENDYTLTVQQSEEQEREGYDGGYKPIIPHLVSSIRRTFNFLSAQVTTMTRDWAFQNAGNSDGGTSSAIATTTIIQNFNDVQCSAEIKSMHAKLTELGGKPPSLEDVLPNEMHKRATGSPNLGQG